MTIKGCNWGAATLVANFCAVAPGSKAINSRHGIPFTCTKNSQLWSFQSKQGTTGEVAIAQYMEIVICQKARHF